jgi:membrane-bound O-acyltransferase family protein
MVWGYFLKLVLANRLSILVQSGFENPQSQAGILLILSVLAFTFEIYCDFYGYSSIAKGCAALLGIEVMDNFKSPYLSGNIAEFWRRWHISLSTWFRDYLYIPLGGNRRGNLRRDRNLLIVFLVSGIWHGAGITYLFWGFLHGLALIVYDRSKAVFAWGEKRVGIRTGALSHRIFCGLLNLSFVSFAWIFFHATTLSQGFSVVRNLFPLHLDRIFAGGILQMGLDLPNLLVLLVGLALLLFADLCTDRGLVLRERIATQGVWLRFLIEIGAICLILILGIWGASIQGDSFIYAQF